jgi:L-fuconolactonase
MKCNGWLSCFSVGKPFFGHPCKSPTMRIDSHQHFWKYNAIRDSWITEEMSIIQKDFLPTDLLPILQQHGFDGCVVVQSDQSEGENNYQLRNAEANDLIKGIVGWVNFQNFDIEERLAYWSRFPKLKGFRHVLQGEPDRGLMLKQAFKNGISQLSRYGYTYDLLILPDQLRYAYQLAAGLPYQRFVIDHIAKPPIKAADIADWKRDIGLFGPLENVYCKISGMVTEADWHHWQTADFRPYLDVVVETFGPERIMYGSDWPVCLVAADYGAMLGIVQDYFKTFSQTEQDAFFGDNAVKFYQL